MHKGAEFLEHAFRSGAKLFVLKSRRPLSVKQFIGDEHDRGKIRSPESGHRAERRVLHVNGNDTLPLVSFDLFFGFTVYRIRGPDPPLDGGALFPGQGTDKLFPERIVAP